MEAYTLEEMMDQFVAELDGCVSQHDYQRLYDFVILLIQKITETTGEPMSGAQFFEPMGYGFLSEKHFEKAYVMFQTAARCCDSAMAQFNLGNMFVSGDGVQSNLCAAYYWYTRASQNNVEDGDVMCDRILRYVAEEGSPLSNILYGGKDTALPGLRRAMNVGMFIDGLTSLCESDNDMVPRDPQMAEHLKERRPHLMEKYK